MDSADPARRPLQFPLASNEQERMHRVSWVGVDQNIGTILRVVFGPVSATVLTSLHKIGLPAMQDELAELRRHVDEGATEADDHQGAVRQAVLAWRINGLAGRLGEQLGALIEAIDSWHRAGQPVWQECTLGEDFLRSKLTNAREIVLHYSDWRAAYKLLDYPQASSLVRVLTNAEVDQLGRRLKRSAKATAAQFGEIAEAISHESHRTFIRWKHTVSITSPRVAPIWIAQQDAHGRKAAIDALSTGFGIVDVEPRQGHEPYVIVWPDPQSQLRAGTILAETLIVLTTLMLEAVLRWGDPRLPALPLHPSVAPSAEHERLSAKLAAGHYRRRLAARAFASGALVAD